MRAQNVNFNREGTPFEKLGIGRHGIKRALLDNPIKLDTMEGDGMRDWLNGSLPEDFLETIEYNQSDPLSFTDYLIFDVDYYLENEAPEEVDYDEFRNDFTPTGKRINFPKGFQYQEGVLPDGSKVIYFIDGLGSGYMARKEWLK